MSSELIELEAIRMVGISNFLQAMDLTILKASVEYEILDYKLEKNIIHLFVLEGISLFWFFNDSLNVIESGYGTEHNIYIDFETMTILSDEYYEKDFSGVSTTKRSDIYSIAEEIELLNAVPQDISKYVTESKSYSVSLAVQYARGYSSEYDSTSYKGYLAYNRKYKNLNVGSSSDCANFVSQCLSAGNLSMTSTSGLWYYNDNGTPCTTTSHKANENGNYSSHSCTTDDTFSAGWSSCSNQRSALNTLFGSQVYGPNCYTNESVYLGNLLYTNSGGHVYICTDASSSIRCYTCHSLDRWNYPLNITTISSYILRL